MALIQHVGRVQFDFGARSTLAAELAGLGVTRPLIISDRFLVGQGLLARALGPMLEKHFPVFSDVQTNPRIETAHRATAAYLQAGCDGIVAVGGGSVIDTAKATALLATHEGHHGVYRADRGGTSLIGEVAPLIAMPTTAGTGTEIGRGAGITFEDGEKSGFFSIHLVPRVAICDPELTFDLPPHLTAGTGIDAFSHAVEGYLAPVVNPPADAAALDAIRRLSRYLPVAVANGHDREARWQVMMGALEAAMGQYKGLGPAHALSMPFDRLDLHHGTVVGILLSHAVRFVRPAVEAPKLALLAEALECSIDGIPAAIDALVRRIGVPSSLHELGVERRMLKDFSEQASASPFNATGARRGSAADYLRMAQAAYA